METLVLEIKEVVLNADKGDVDGYLKEIANKYEVEYDKILVLFDTVSEMYIEYQNSSYSKSKKRLWGKKEDIFLMEYMEYCLELNSMGGGKKIKEVIFKELAEMFFSRTASSVQFRYYELRHRDYDVLDNKENNIFNDTRYIASSEYVIDSKIDNTVKPTVETGNVNSNTENLNTEDLLDMVINIVDNVDNLGLDVTGLFQGLFVLSNKAVENSKLEEIKLQMLNVENDKAKLEMELKKEKEEKNVLINELNKIKDDFDNIKREVRMFDSLSGKNKIKKLNNFKSNMRTIVDKYEPELKV